MLVVARLLLRYSIVRFEIEVPAVFPGKIIVEFPVKFHPSAHPTAISLLIRALRRNSFLSSFDRPFRFFRHAMYRNCIPREYFVTSPLKRFMFFRCLLD